LVAGALALAFVPLPASCKRPRDHFFDVTHATQSNVEASPDGKAIYFDLLGSIYRVPVTGGRARSVVSTASWATAPRISSDGKYIAYLVDGEGDYLDVVVARLIAPDKALAVIRDVSEFQWTAQGNMIAVPGRLCDIAIPSCTETTRQIQGLQVLGVSPEINDGVFLSNGKIFQKTPADRVHQVSNDDETAFSPLISRGGRYLAFASTPTASSTNASLNVIDRSTGRRRTYLSGQLEREDFLNEPRLPNYAFEPGDRGMLITLQGRIHRLDLRTGNLVPVLFRANVREPRRALGLPDSEALAPSRTVRHIRWIDSSNDRYVFGALGKIWEADHDGKRPRRITDSKEFEYYPSTSPSGRNEVAYVTWSDETLGELDVASLGGSSKRTLASGGYYANPVWFPDGQRIAYVQGSSPSEMFETIYTDKNRRSIQIVDLRTGNSHPLISFTQPATYITRYNSPLSINHDGTELYVMMGSPDGNISTKRLVGVDALTGTTRDIATFDWTVDAVHLSPSGKWIVILGRQGVWVVDAPARAAKAIDLRTVDLNQLRRISARPATYARWLADDELVWTYLNTVHWWTPTGARQVPARIQLPVPRRPDPKALALTHVTVLSPGRPSIRNGTIVIRHGRLSYVGSGHQSRIPTDATVLDLRGKFVIPGLIDAHVHSHNAVFGGREIFPQVRREYLAMLAFGVTTIFDPAAPNEDVFPQEELVRAGMMTGPRVYSTGLVMNGDRNFSKVRISSLYDAKQLALTQRDAGAIYLKSYRLRTNAERIWLARAAAGQGLGITAEGGGRVSYDLQLAADGYTAVEHSKRITGTVQEDILKFLLAAGTRLTPTTILHTEPIRKSDCRDPVDGPDIDKLGRYFTKEQIDQWDESGVFCIQKLKAGINAARMMQAGIPISTGSHDSPPGLGVHIEGWLLAAGGARPADILYAMTMGGAIKLGIADKVGSVSAGKIADLVVVNRNPLVDIRNTTSIRLVIQDGAVVKQTLPRHVN
jgi:imidazolonepropionase-like amidohydrolase/Tol biopolymer transport system component